MRVTKAELAELLGVVPGSLPRLVAQGMPEAVEAGGGRGKAASFDAGACMAWQRAQLMSKAASGTPRDEYLRALTEKARLDIATRKGDLVEAEVVAREFAECAANVKARLRRIPDAVADRIANVTDPQAAKALLLGEIDDALLELSRLANDHEE